MALRFLESFDFTGDALTGAALSTELNKKWTANSLATACAIVTGWGAGKALNLDISNTNYVEITLDNQQEWVVGFAFSTTSCMSSAAAYPFLTFYDTTNEQVSLRLTVGNRSLALYRGGAYVESSLQTPIQQNSPWAYLEVYAKIDNASGVITVKLNGVQIYSYSGDTQTTANAYANKIRFSNPQCDAGGSYYIDDIYIADGSTFFGPGKVEELHPTSDATPNDWTPSATGSDHYTFIDEKPGDNATTYLADDTTGQEEQFGFSDLPGITTNIQGIQICTQAGVNTAGSLTLQDLCDNGPNQTTHNFTVNNSGTYITEKSIMSTDPDGSAWTAANLNACTFGIKVG